MPSNDCKRTKIISIPINDPNYVHLCQIMERSLERRQRQLEISVANTLFQMHDMKACVRNVQRKAAAEKNAPKLTAEEEAAKKTHDAAVADVFAVLAKTGDKISDEGVEALVAWKLGA